MELISDHNATAVMVRNIKHLPICVQCVEGEETLLGGVGNRLILIDNKIIFTNEM